jgi:hypothetical protein
MRKAKCVMPVLIFEPELVGEYKAGQVIEGEQAELLLRDHDSYFTEVDGEEN